MAASVRWLVPVGVLIAVLVGAVLWHGGPARPTAPVATSYRGPDVATDAPASAVEPDAPTGARAAVLGDEKARHEALQETAASGAEAVASETWTLWGHVLRAADGTPAEGLVVLLREDVRGVSDARGRFEIELDATRFPRGSRRVVNVRHGSGAILLGDEHVLEPGIELRVEDEIVWLHGRVVDALGAPLLLDGISLSCWSAEGLGRFLGHQPVCDVDGSFRIASQRSELECDPVSVLVALGPTRYPLPTTLQELQSEEGATVVLDVCPFRIEVRATDGGELAQPELRVVAWRPGVQRAEVFSYPELGASGEVELFVERGVERIEIGAGAEGCSPWIEERAAPRCGETLRIELARLGPDDVLEGVVLDADGRPVERAFASCSPPARDDRSVAVPAIRGMRTDAEGRFKLPFPVGRTARVMAYHRDHGSTGDVLVLGGRRDLVLHFAASARVDVQVTAPDGASPGAAPARFLLALADGERRFDWGAHGRTWFEEVPAGSHRVLCLSADGDLWGLFELEVFDTQPLAWTRALQPARWVEGTLVGSAGSALEGIDVSRLDAPLDPGEEWNPYRARTDGEGRFRVLLGTEAEGELAFARDGRELGRARLAAGDAGSVRLILSD